MVWSVNDLSIIFMQDETETTYLTDNNFIPGISKVISFAL